VCGGTTGNGVVVLEGDGHAVRRAELGAAGSCRIGGGGSLQRILCTVAEGVDDRLDRFQPTQRGLDGVPRAQVSTPHGARNVRR
jgi:hypothetical protein